MLVGFALAGGFPETYRAALPLPGTAAGRRRARTVESFGMISVSSVYSVFALARQPTILSNFGFTFIRVLFVDLQVEV